MKIARSFRTSKMQGKCTTLITKQTTKKTLSLKLIKCKTEGSFLQVKADILFQALFKKTATQCARVTGTGKQASLIATLRIGQHHIRHIRRKRNYRNTPKRSNYKLGLPVHRCPFLCTASAVC